MRIQMYMAWSALCAAVAPASAFLNPLALQSERSSALLLRASSNDNFFATLANPFSAETAAPAAETGSAPDTSDFDPSPNGLIRQARRLIASDFGILDPDLLDDTGEFVWIGPFVDEPLEKNEYLAAGRFFDLRGAFPDLDYRPHDFRMDETDSMTLRFTCRVTGTMRGALRLRDGTFPPTGKKMKCPPEAVTVQFDEQTGKVVKLCTGFCMDRQVGNTKGATGIMAAALVAGQPPSDWDLYPAPDVFKRFLGRPVQPILETKSVLAPFPETVMIQLAKGILATNMASNDPSLLADQFEFSTPYKGPIRKQQFIERFALEEFADVDPTLSHFRVDPYDPVRVWIDVLPKGVGYQGCPQAMSFSFDDEGFCERITASFVIDPSVGNGGGLGGPEGYRYAIGKGTPDLLTRPWARVLGRIRKQVLSPLTGVGVDDYLTSAQAKAKPESPLKRESELLPSAAVESLSALRGPSLQPVPPSVEPPGPSEAEISAQNRKRAEEEEARLKNEGTEEAKVLMAEVEEATKRALEAREKLEKLEQQKLESERKMKIAQEQNAARMAKIEAEQSSKAAAAEKAAQRAEQLKAEKEIKATQKAGAEKQSKKLQEQKGQKPMSVMEKARAAAAEMAAQRAEQLKANRLDAERRLKVMEDKRKAQAEERKKKQEAAARATEEKRKAQAEERKKKQAALKAMDEQRRAQAVERKKKQEAALKEMEEKRKAVAEERKKKQEAARAEAERRKQEAIAKREAAAQERKEQLELKKAQAEEQRSKLKAAAEAKRAAAAEARKKLIESQKADQARQAEQRKQQAQNRQKAEEERKKALRAKKVAPLKRQAAPEEEEDEDEARLARQKAALAALTNSVQRATISLLDAFNPGGKDVEKTPASPSRSISRSIPIGQKKAAPKGVPVLRKWRRTPTGGITGFISGSRQFADGDKITTSPIAQGTVGPGQLVRTGSGTKYFLE